MRIVSFDLSLTSTGFADAEGVSVIKTVGLSGYRRLQYIRDAVLRRSRGADVVVLEGYSFASINQAHQIGELGGVVRLALYENSVRFALVAPTSLKKFATGKGNAKKPDMLAAAFKRLGYEGSNFDEVDALWLRTMALDYYGDPQLPSVIPEAHRVALKAVEWPKYEWPKAPAAIAGEDSAVSHAQPLGMMGCDLGAIPVG